MLGILVGLRGKYDISSNKETGLGRADMVLIPKNPDKNAIILELKVCDHESKLEKTSLLREKKYAGEFKGLKTYISMAFCANQMACHFFTTD